MATVYLAEDLKHQRKVAVKVLRPELAAVLGGDRFLQEIRVTANLQHPHILPLHDSGIADGFLYYVMPFVDGESLRDRLSREKQLPITDALRIAREVADALGHAHAQGVIHRDIKPENILLQGGHALVADFGIALAVQTAGGQRMTQTGLSVGTPQYMSPEQAMGERAVDARSDVYSLGCVLYEMLAGEPPHTGPTAQAILARVLTDKPRSVRSSRASVPDPVEWAIERALEKLPADRFATAQEFAAVLGLSRSETPPASATGRRAPPWARRVVPWAVAAAVTAVVAAVTVRWMVARAAGQQPSISFLIEAPPFDGGTGRFGMMGLSPDGQTIAFVLANDTSSQVFVRRLSDVTARPLAGTRGAFDLFFSPDSKTIAFFSQDGHLRKVLVDGGGPTTLADAPTSYSGGAWGRDQQIVIGTQGSDNGLRQLSSAGGASLSFTKSKTQHARPLIAPDGETVLFTDWGPGYTEDDFLGIGSRSTGRFMTTKLLISEPLGIVDGYAIVVTADGAIKAVPFDSRAQRLTGDAIHIQEGLSTYRGSGGPARIAANGTFAYQQGSPAGHLTIGDSTGLRSLGGEKRNFQAPRFSPDGRRIATAILEQRGDTITSDIFTFDISTGTLNRLTSRGDAIMPVWAADGKSIVFTTWYQTRPSIWRQRADGGEGTADKLLELPSGGERILSAVPTPDGRGIVFSRAPPDGVSGRLFLLPLEGDRTPRPIATGTALSIMPAVSPDGRWLAFVGSDASPSLGKVIVVPLGGSPGQRVQVSLDIGDEPVWSRDGSRLYYREAGAISVATLKHDGAAVQVTGRAPLFPNLKRLDVFDMAPDGRRALTVQPDADDVRLVVVTNWVRRLRERIAEARGRK